MAFPNFDFCIVCEQIRPEMGRKLTILGFYGIAPHVEILVGDQNQPIILALVAGFAPIADAGSYSGVMVISKPDGSVAFQTPPMPIQFSSTGRGILGIGVPLAPPVMDGRYSVRFLVNGQPKLDTSFNIRRATQAELSGIGVPATGRPS